MLYLIMSLVVVTVMHVLSMLSLVLVPVASKEGTVSSQLVVARKGLKKATGANPSNPLFNCHSTLSSATRLPSDRSSALVKSRQLSRHRKMDVEVDEYG